MTAAKSELLRLFDCDAAKKPVDYSIQLSAFSDSGRLGFELANLKLFVEENPDTLVRLRLNALSWGYTWDYGADSEPALDMFLPPNLPLHALVEAARFALVIQGSYPQMSMLLELPPVEHAATKFVIETELFRRSCKISYSLGQFEETAEPGSDDVLIPLTVVGPETSGQLTQLFHGRFDRLADAGKIDRQFRGPLRQVVMEAAENADTWGGRGYIAAYLRQENRGRVGFHQSASFVPERETHLYIHVFSIDSSLGATLKMPEHLAADAAFKGGTARAGGVGQGLPFILETTTKQMMGTVYLCSGGFTRIVSPDSLSREFSSAGADYLPGTHLMVVVPLFAISTLASSQPASATTLERQDPYG